MMDYLKFPFFNEEYTLYRLLLFITKCLLIAKKSKILTLKTWKILVFRKIKKFKVNYVIISDSIYYFYFFLHFLCFRVVYINFGDINFISFSWKKKIGKKMNFNINPQTAQWFIQTHSPFIFLYYSKIKILSDSGVGGGTRCT